MKLDNLPLPNRRVLPMHKYGEYAGSIFTSRGCPYSCTFCSRPIFGKVWRGHSPYRVIDEMDVLINKAYKVKTVSICDDNFSFDIARSEEILDDIIARKWKIDLYFWNGLRVDNINKNLLKK